MEKVKETRGGLALFTSSMVQTQSLGFAIVISCLHHVRLKFYGLTTFLSVNQHGPLIFCFRMNSSSMLYCVPKTASNVLPVRLAGRGGIVAGYLILRILCSPCSKGVSKQYFRQTPLHLSIVMSLNLRFLNSSSSVYTLVRHLFSSSALSVPRAFFTLGIAYIVLSIPSTFRAQETY